MIYLLKSNDKLKIGYTANFATRIKSYKTYNPDIEILNMKVGEMEDEKLLHKEFQHLFLFGEWFSYSTDIINRFENYQPKSTKILKHTLVDSLTEHVVNLNMTTDEKRLATVKESARYIYDEIVNNKEFNALTIKCNGEQVYKRYGHKYTLHKELQ